jgi:O-succinylbenzoic acid--CoA ligase
MTQHPEKNALRLNHELIDKTSIKGFISREQDPLITEVLHFLNFWYNSDDFIKQQTSGSTGPPKMISVPKGMMMNSAAMTNRFFGLNEGHSALLCLSPQYIAGKMMIIRAILGGFKLITTNVSANPLATLNESVSFTAMVPLQVAETLRQNPERLELVNTLIIGGSSLDQKTEHALQEVKTSCWHTYGMTETLSHIALRKINGSDKSKWYSPLKDISLRADDRQCLVVDAPLLSSELVVTNDLVRFDLSGGFQIIGRADDVIFSAGHKIHPVLLEQKLEPLIPYPFMISSKPGFAGDEHVLVVQHELQISELFVLWQQMTDVLPAHEVPRIIEYTDRLPMLPSGKINRLAMKAILASSDEKTDESTDVE